MGRLHMIRLKAFCMQKRMFSEADSEKVSSQGLINEFELIQRKKHMGRFKKKRNARLEIKNNKSTFNQIKFGVVDTSKLKPKILLLRLPYSTTM